MKHTATLLALGMLAALPPAAHAGTFASACTSQNLNVGVKMAQSSFFRQFHNQDLTQSITELRESAQADMANGNVESCGLKAATINAMLKDPARARITLTEYQSSVASASGGAVVNTHSVPAGPHITQEQLMGRELRSINNKTLGVITGMVYSQTGQPLYITLTPPASVQATTPIDHLTVPVGLLLVGSNPHVMYVSVNSRDFWKEPRFRSVDVPQVEPAG
jgi:hypothetical protein